MVEMTMLLPEELAEQIRPLNGYLPTVLQLSLIGFRTLATETATEITEFLLSEPSSQQVIDYHVSERAQKRLQRLLALNDAGLLGVRPLQENKCSTSPALDRSNQLWRTSFVECRGRLPA